MLNQSLLKLDERNCYVIYVSVKSYRCKCKLDFNMKNFDKKIIDFEKSNPLSLFYDFGYDPEDIKISIIDCFSDYFQDRDRLNNCAITYLVDNWFSYLTICRDDSASLKYIKILLDIFNGAKSENIEKTIQAYTYWYPHVSQSISRFWSLYNNQNNIKELCLEDFLDESLGLIGQSIEGLSKPFIKLLLHLNRIKRGKACEISEIVNKDLGVAIDELMNTSNLQDMFTVSPLGIRLNQWRNIAYHHNSKVVNNKMFFWYKMQGQLIEFSLTRDELFDSLNRILIIFKILRISDTIFFVDNLDELQKGFQGIEIGEIHLREESRLLDFHSRISSQGFKVDSLIFDKDVAVLKLVDMQNYSNFKKRAIHSSQFLYSLWLYSNSSKLIVEYYLSSGELFFTSEIDSLNFVNQALEVTDISEILKNVSFSYISTEYKQNINPFENIQLSKSIRNVKQVFYSQCGEEICVEDFIRQFSLSVFTNYLVLASEGLKDISIIIGSDGALLSAKTCSRDIVLRTPAIIENTDLQLKLIELQYSLIELYDKKELVIELVEEARFKNRYYDKIIMTKDKLANINSGIKTVF